MATLIYTDGRTVPLQLDADPLPQLQAIVGGYIEVVYLDGHRDLLVLDEDGKGKQRPINLVATRLAHAGHRIVPMDWICGDVVRCTVEHAGTDRERWI